MIAIVLIGVAPAGEDTSLVTREVDDDKCNVADWVRSKIDIPLFAALRRGGEGVGLG